MTLLSDSSNPKIAVLVAAHNRRDVTMRGLRSLHDALPAFDLTVVLFDDGSSDGTADAVCSAFPDTVVLRGDGSAFWNGAMHAAWTHARGLNPDGYMWLNDDVILEPDALVRLRDIWQSLGGRDRPFDVAGATHGDIGQVSYGGYRRVPSRWLFRYKALPFVSTLTPIDFSCGQTVLISQAAVDRVGINDPRYFHGHADWDYGLRANRAGVPVWLAPGTMGRCDGWVHPLTNLGEHGFRERWRRVRSVKAFPIKNWWHFTRAHCGPLFLTSFVGFYLRMMLGPELLPAYRKLQRIGRAIRR